MLKNHLVIAWRNLLKNKLYSLINIAGLATGMACCILVALYVHGEWSYDRFHDNGGRIYRVLREVKTPDGRVVFYPQTAGALVSQLEEVPQVERALRVWNRDAWSGISVSYGDKRWAAGVLGVVQTADNGPLLLCVWRRWDRLSGPPYALAEVVFDEDDQVACSPLRTGAN